MKKVLITNKKHPHYHEVGFVVREDEPLSLSFLGKKDRIRNTDDEEFFADKEDYTEIL